MKTVSGSDGSRMDAGRLFHTRGPSTAKDRSPNVVLVGGTLSLVVDDDDLRPDRKGADQAAVINQIGRCAPIEALVDQHRQLKHNPLPNW